MTWHNINVQNPWFTYIASGEKTVEGRLNTSKFASLKNIKHLKNIYLKKVLNVLYQTLKH